MVRCASEPIGLANTIRDLGHKARVRIWTDAAAARGMALRSGSGAIKHMLTKYFWLQLKEKTQKLWIENIRDTVNPADLMTKHLDGKRLTAMCDLLNIRHNNDRLNSAPKLTTDTENITRAPRALAVMTQQTKLLCVADRYAESGSTKWTVGRALDG